MDSLNKGLLTAIRLKLIGCTNSFRIPEYHTYHKTLIFPPKTTVCGMIGAAMGYSPQEVNEKILPQLKVAILIEAIAGEVKDLWKIKKVTNYSKGDEKMEDCVVIDNKSFYGAVLLRELLYQPQYTIYLTSENMELLKEVFVSLQNPQWALSLGREDELVKLQCQPQWIHIEEHQNLWFSNTVLPFDVNQVKYELDPNSIQASERRRLIVPPMVYKLPMEFEYQDSGERSGVNLQHFTAVLGMRIRPKEKAMGWVDGERAFQFF